METWRGLAHCCCTSSPWDVWSVPKAAGRKETGWFVAMCGRNNWEALVFQIKCYRFILAGYYMDIFWTWRLCFLLYGQQLYTIRRPSHPLIQASSRLKLGLNTPRFSSYRFHHVKPCLPLIPISRPQPQLQGIFLWSHMWSYPCFGRFLAFSPMAAVLLRFRFPAA